MYQEALVKLVTVVLEDQPDLSPADRRTAFKNYMTLITIRFSRDDSVQQSDKAQAEKYDEDLRRAEEEKNRQNQMHEQARNQRRENDNRAKYKAEEPKPTTNSNSESATANRDRQDTFQTKVSVSGERNAYLFASFLVFLGFSVWLIVNLGNSESTLQSTEKQKLAQLPAPSVAPTAFVLTHSVAAISANFRTEPTPQSQVKATLKQGDSFSIISSQEKFLKVRLANGDLGFIARELVIPIGDYERLSKVSAQSYVENRLPEKRIETLLVQSQSQKAAFLAVLFGLTNHSDKINSYLDELEVAGTFGMATDEPAATWFSIAANAALKSGDYEDAYWKARAAVEAEPANADHHVAFALANYKLGKYEAVKLLGSILPKLAPRSTNAWMIFALADSLEEGPTDELTKAAVVLSIRLSRNGSNTRKYFRDLALNADQTRTRELINKALLEEANDPNLFSSVTAVNVPLSPR